MESLQFESRDLAAIEEFLNRAYTKAQIGSGGADVRARVSRQATGSIEDHATDGWEDDFRPGDLVSFAPPDRPYSGTINRSTYTITMFGPALLTRAAGVGRKDDSRSGC